MSEHNVNDLWWRIGWNPTMVIGAIGIAGLALGTYIGGDPGMWIMVGGFLAGGAVWIKGVQHINENYGPMLEEFYSDTTRAAARGIQSHSDDTYAFKFPGGHPDIIRDTKTHSPPLVKPKRIYDCAVVILTDVSVTINQMNTFNMEMRANSSASSNSEYHFDQITNIETHEAGNKFTIEIITSSGQSKEIECTAANADTANELTEKLRQGVRDAKRA